MLGGGGGLRFPPPAPCGRRPPGRSARPRGGPAPPPTRHWSHSPRTHMHSPLALNPPRLSPLPAPDLEPPCPPFQRGSVPPPLATYPPSSLFHPSPTRCPPAPPSPAPVRAPAPPPPPPPSPPPAPPARVFPRFRPQLSFSPPLWLSSTPSPSAPGPIAAAAAFTPLCLAAAAGNGISRRRGRCASGANGLAGRVEEGRRRGLRVGRAAPGPKRSFENG